MIIGDTLKHGEWDNLDRVVGRAVAPRSDCEVALRAAGMRLDVNTASREMLDSLLSRLGFAATARDSLIDALMDWRDSDDVPRPHGGEHAWYEARGLQSPRNGPLADVRELARVRGFGRISGLDTLLDVEPARIAMSRAPLLVLEALPGIGPEGAERLMAMRIEGTPYREPVAFSGSLGESARAAVFERFSELSAMTAASPDAWILTSKASMGSPRVTVVVEYRFVRAGTRAAVVRHRLWFG